MKTLSILIFYLLFNQNSNYDFYDSCENEITVENIERLPKAIDSTFFKNNFSSNLLEKEFCDKKFKFKIRITKVKKVSKNRFDVTICSTATGENVGIEQVLKYRGYSHYLMKTKTVLGEHKLECIKWSYGEI